VGGIAVGPDGETWIGTTRGVAKLSARLNPVWVTHDPSDGTIPDRQVFDVAVDRRGVAFVATASGGSAIDSQRGAYLYSVRNTPLMHQILDVVHVDADGRVWFGGAGGVNVFAPSTRIPATAPRTEMTTAEAASRAGGGDGNWILGLTRYNTDGMLPDT
jgi:ligand-binding sensor domain-containing protein